MATLLREHCWHPQAWHALCWVPGTAANPGAERRTKGEADLTHLGERTPSLPSQPCPSGKPSRCPQKAGIQSLTFLFTTQGLQRLRFWPIFSGPQPWSPCCSHRPWPRRIPGPHESQPKCCCGDRRTREVWCLELQQKLTPALLKSP